MIDPNMAASAAAAPLPADSSVALGGAAGGMPDDLMNARLSQVLGGLADTGKMFHLASKLIKNKDAKTMLNLMAMTTGAAATTKDPMALMQAVQGPMTDIGAITKEDQQKRMSDIMPPVNKPTTTGMPTMNPVGNRY